MVLHCHAQIIAYLMIYSVLDLHKKKKLYNAWAKAKFIFVPRAQER